MTRVPMLVTAQQGPGVPFGPRMLERYDHGLVPQGVSAEMVAEQWGFSRQELDTLSLESHQRASVAIDEGRFKQEIAPVPVSVDGVDGLFETDEGVSTLTRYVPEGISGSPK